MKWYKVHAKGNMSGGKGKLGIGWEDYLNTKEEDEDINDYIMAKAEAWLGNKLTHEKQRGMAVMKGVYGNFIYDDDYAKAETLAVLEARDSEELPEGAMQISKEEAMHLMERMKKWLKLDDVMVRMENFEFKQIVW